MGAIFNTPQKPINYDNPQQALKQLENMIRTMQDQLEYTLMNLDSTNVTEISTDQTKIVAGSGESVISGSQISLSGGGKAFRAGWDSTINQFRFEVTDNTGTNVLYLNSSGELVITKTATLSIDGGAW